MRIRKDENSSTPFSEANHSTEASASDHKQFIQFLINQGSKARVGYTGSGDLTLLHDKVYIISPSAFEESLSSMDVSAAKQTESALSSLINSTSIPQLKKLLESFADIADKQSQASKQAEDKPLQVAATGGKADLIEEEDFVVVKENTQPLSKRQVATQNLLSEDELSSKTIDVYLEYLQDTKGLIYVNSLILPESKKIDEVFESIEMKIPRAAEKNHQIFVPILLQNTAATSFLNRFIFGAPDHMVALVISPAQKQIFYYDPKGGSPCNSSVKNQNFTARALANTLSEKLNYKSLYSKAKHQNIEDSKNHGAHVLQFIEFPNPNRTPLSPKEYRNQIAKNLESYPLSNANTVEEIQSFFKRVGLEEKRELSLKYLLESNSTGVLGNQDELLRQINLDIPRHGGTPGHIFDGKEITTAQELFEKLKTFTKDENEALKLMSLFQQAVFRNFQFRIYQKYKTGSSKLPIGLSNSPKLPAGTPSKLFSADSVNKTLTFTNYLEVKTELPNAVEPVSIALLKSSVEVDYRAGKAFEKLEIQLLPKGKEKK